MKINNILDLSTFCQQNNCNKLARRIKNMYALRNSVGYAGRDLQYLFDITRQAVLNENEEDLLDIVNEVENSMDENDVDYLF